MGKMISILYGSESEKGLTLHARICYHNFNISKKEDFYEYFRSF